MNWRVLALPFHLLSLVSLAEKPFMATPFRVETVQPAVPFLASSTGSQMQVRKRNGSLEAADVNKIVRGAAIRRPNPYRE